MKGKLQEFYQNCFGKPPFRAERPEGKLVRETYDRERMAGGVCASAEADFQFGAVPCLSKQVDKRVNKTISGVLGSLSIHPNIKRIVFFFDF